MIFMKSLQDSRCLPWLPVFSVQSRFDTVYGRFDTSLFRRVENSFTYLA